MLVQLSACARALAGAAPAGFDLQSGLRGRLLVTIIATWATFFRLLVLSRLLELRRCQTITFINPKL